jgi:Na+-transporting methylmalonyl-CoA/oxaloacetate decarboxylase gamma subunit
MVKIVLLFLLVVLGFCTLIFKLWKNLVDEPGKAGKNKTPAASAPAQPHSSAEVKRAAAKSVRYHREVLRGVSDERRDGHAGSAWLLTNRNRYIVGEISEFGMVEAIRCPSFAVGYAVAKCIDESGTVYVVAQSGIDTDDDDRDKGTDDNKQRRNDRDSASRQFTSSSGNRSGENRANDSTYAGTNGVFPFVQSAWNSDRRPRRRTRPRREGQT